MPYLEQFMQQWKSYLKQQLEAFGLGYVITDGGDTFDLKANSLVYFRALRRSAKSITEMDSARDNLVWTMLEKQLIALANKAEIGALDLSSKLHIEAPQILICLNFSYDNEQHIIYVS